MNDVSKKSFSRSVQSSNIQAIGRIRQVINIKHIGIQVVLHVSRRALTEITGLRYVVQTFLYIIVCNKSYCLIKFNISNNHFSKL